MAWYKSSNGNNIRPSDVDDTSSKVYVYVRKDFNLIPESGEDDNIIPEHWEYLEQKILKEDFELYLTVADHTSEISEVEDALVELAGLITEVV